MFQWDAELADQYYLEHYADTNKTVYICTPYVLVSPVMRAKYIQTHPYRYTNLRCGVFQLGYIKRLHQKRHWSFYFSAEYPVVNRIYDMVRLAISITGILGE